VRKISSRPQRTLARAAEIRGVGFVTGAEVCVRFRPAPPHSGLAFVRTDLPGKPVIPAVVANVSGATRRTTLGRPPAQIELVEHALAALTGLRIDNCTIEIDGPELPGLDGSALGFASVLCEAGTVVQRAVRDVWTAEAPITVGDSSSNLTFHPAEADCLRITYLMDYGAKSPIPRQRYTQDISPEGLLNGLADCRTFLLAEEAAQFRRMGWGTRVTASDLVIFGARGPEGNPLRYEDEPARHKALDIAGDLGLAGYALGGHVVGYRSGHALNVALARRLAEVVAGRQPLLQCAA
jgi:UDP-3-O-acyl N-acetylglucosamine deacetylase